MTTDEMIVDLTDEQWRKRLENVSNDELLFGWLNLWIHNPAVSEVNNWMHAKHCLLGAILERMEDK